MTDADLIKELAVVCRRIRRCSDKPYPPAHVLQDAIFLHAMSDWSGAVASSLDAQAALFPPPTKKSRNKDEYRK